MADGKRKGRKFGRVRRGSEGNVEEWLKRKREEGERNGEGMFCKNRKTTGSPDGKEERGEELRRWREEIEVVMREREKRRKNIIIRGEEERGDRGDNERYRGGC